MALRRSRLRALLLLSFMIGVLVQGCIRSSFEAPDGNVCGAAQSRVDLNGLYWLLGTPTGASTLCSIQDGRFKLVKVLDPESRDPLLMQDALTDQLILIERFSSRFAKPTRASWYSGSSGLLTQHGDWPQNTYSVMRISSSSGIATGFDFAEVRQFNWSETNPAQVGKLNDFSTKISKSNPILTLKNGSWMAVLDGGYDLQSFTPILAKAFVFNTEEKDFIPVEIKIQDVEVGLTCKNAFQSLLQSNSKAIVSCNPQYFGAVDGETLGVFQLELTSSGEVRVRNLISRGSKEIQRIDLWGFDFKINRVFVGLKLTTVDDFNGTLASAGWITVEDAGWKEESRVTGPFRALPSGLFVFACQHESPFCKQGEFVVLDESRSEWSVIRPEFLLPFHSFPTSIPLP